MKTNHNLYMKKLFFLLPVAMLSLASCSSDEPVIAGNEELTEAKYLSVNIASNMVGSRAAGDQVADGNSIYEAGQAAENEVSNIRFFFFDENGDALEVKAASNKNWVDVVPTTAEGGENMPNIEKALDAMIILEKGDKEPTSIIAVLNHPFDYSSTMVSKSELTDMVGSYTTASGFPMSNSVYKTADGKMYAEVPVAGHMYSTPSAAKGNPITIYVERVHAKVRVNVASELTKGTKLADGIYQPGVSADGNGQFKGKDLCIKILGWNVTNTANKSYLVKHIDTAWPADMFGASEPWNYPAFFRSYWAVNPALTAIDDYTYGNFNNGATGAQNKAMGAYTYLQENAADLDSWNSRSTVRPSQVIIAAQLGTYENGVFTEAEVAEWAFNRYSVDELKTAMLYVAPNYYKKVTENGNEVFRQISADDITFKTAMAVTPGLDWRGTGRYYVYAQLTDEAAAASWHRSNVAGNTDVITAANLNEALKGLGHAKIWSQGYTYYYFDIRHLADALDADGKDNGGFYGVVRNHLYDAAIKSLVGLGTPVYDPTEVIYPEKPTDDDTYIAADIKILSWRLVKQDVELEW